jgi:hypothetical protein
MSDTFVILDNLVRIHRLCHEIEARLPPPPTDCMSIQEFGRLLVDELSRALSISVARRWAREHLRASRCRHPRKLKSWKRRFEHANPKRSITQDEFAKALADTGIKVVGDDVYCEETEA